MRNESAIATLKRTVEELARANRVGSQINALLAGLTTAAVEEDARISATVVAYGFQIGDYANQFRSQLTVSQLEALAKDLAVHCESSKPDDEWAQLIS